MNYLTQTFEEFRKHFRVDIIRQYGDPAVYCYHCKKAGGEFLYVAKDSSLGYTVSIHKDLVHFSAKNNLQIVMCLQGTYWKMWGSVILVGNPVENERNGVKMLNFPINKCGAEIIPLPAHANPVGALLPKTTEQMKMVFGK